MLEPNFVGACWHVITIPCHQLACEVDPRLQRISENVLSGVRGYGNPFSSQPPGPPRQMPRKQLGAKRTSLETGPFQSQREFCLQILVAVPPTFRKIWAWLTGGTSKSVVVPSMMKQPQKEHLKEIRSTPESLGNFSQMKLASKRQRGISFFRAPLLVGFKDQKETNHFGWSH